MHRRLLPLAAVVSALVLFAPVSEAASYSYADAKGDAAAGQVPGMDIVSVTYSTTGQKVGKTYKPTQLLIALKLAGPVRTEAGTRYRVDATIDGCGFFNAMYAPGTAFAAVVGPGTVFMECGSAPDETGSTATLLTPKVTAVGDTITWFLPLKTLPKEIKAGSVITDFAAFTDVVEPVLGSLGTSELVPQASVDAATGAGSYRIS